MGDNACMGREFFNLYRHNFVRVAVAIPEVRVADPAFNACQIVALLGEAAKRRAVLAVFPELGLTAYSCEDLFHQQALLDGAVAALGDVVRASAGLDLVAVVGLPVRVDGLLYNCAAVLHRGRILGVVPKTYPPNYREFYELRHFAPASYAGAREIDLAGQRGVPFGARLLFEAEDQPGFVLAAEICEDLWTPIPPSSYGARAGAPVRRILVALRGVRPCPCAAGAARVRRPSRGQ